MKWPNKKGHKTTIKAERVAKGKIKWNSCVQGTFRDLGSNLIMNISSVLSQDLESEPLTPNHENKKRFISYFNNKE